MQTTDAGGTPVDRPVRSLVERLRDACRAGDGCKCTLNEAADEIERLRDALSMVHDWAAFAADMGDALGQRISKACSDALGPNDQFSGGPAGPSRTTGRP